jgi:3-dehydroquinate dehydratase / shikimate dehydrogenase
VTRAVNDVPTPAMGLQREDSRRFLVVTPVPVCQTRAMICISINEESRRMALADMVNAGRQCDLLEVRLDRFGKAPDLGELLAAKPKPVIMSCRRTRDGGHYEGSEEERLALLRQCIVSKADYVEIELDVADQIRRFPPSQRVISYTNVNETPDDIQDIYREMQTKNPDVIKLTTLARTPEEAWPLLQIVARAPVPTVVVGLGKPGIMLSVLGRKIGAPWTYAALERGMEAHPGQPTITDLHSVYHYRSITKQTRLIGVCGFGDRETATTAALNAALVHHELPARCWPLGVGDLHMLRKIMDAVRLAGLVVDPEHQRDIVEIAAEQHPTAEQMRSADLLLHKFDHWKAYNFTCPAVLQALTRALRTKGPAEEPVKDRMVMIVGLTPVARALAQDIQRRGGHVTICSHQRKAGQQLAHDVNCRFIQFEALYTTSHDVLILCDEEKEEGLGRGSAGVHAGYLKFGMTVLDLTAALRRTPFLQGAADRGCIVVEPDELLLDQLEQQARKIAGKDTPRDVLAEAIPQHLREEL